MNRRPGYCKVGELRPSQLLFTFGVGAIVDLPNLSTMIMGLDDWDLEHMAEVGEERLLAAVRNQLGLQVQRLYAPPLPGENGGHLNGAANGSAPVGVPVAPFPRWVRCPWCDLLARLDSGLFELRSDARHPDRIRYVHLNCARAESPPVHPVRFLVACEHGHLDDFPWDTYVHWGSITCQGTLRLRERGVAGEPTDIYVHCDACGKNRPMSDAFGQEGREMMPVCRGRRPHLRDVEPARCTERMKSILLGASNTWFPITLSALSIPTGSDRLAQLAEAHWTILEEAHSREDVAKFRRLKLLRAFAEYGDDDVWGAVEAKRAATADASDEEPRDLKRREWQMFSQPDPTRNTPDFRVTQVAPPPGYERFFSRVVLVERLREVRALLGFTRIESPGDFGEVTEIPDDRRAPLSRRAPRWLPASEVYGEGIFLQFSEARLNDWYEEAIRDRERALEEAHGQWRRARKIEPAEAGFPGVRYALLHSFAHALMRQLALECGYTSASIRERIYSRDAQEPDERMAGVLIYTAAPDSEGTLGGLVSLGKPETLARHLDQALEQMRLCASDPLCAWHHPYRDGVTLHGAACHACLFAPEISCERGNKYLDRTLLVRTFGAGPGAFFEFERDQP